MLTIKFVITAYGIRRAYVWTPRASTWLPISIDRAELMLATNKAKLQDQKVDA